MKGGEETIKLSLSIAPFLPFPFGKLHVTRSDVPFQTLQRSKTLELALVEERFIAYTHNILLCMTAINE
jgi:hypothetical protein